MIPGGNVLNMAMTLIGKQSFMYYRFLTRTPNSIGQDIPSYEEPIAATGSIQPVPRQLYEQQGLDLQKHYVMVHASLDILDIERDISGDMMVWNRQYFQFLSSTEWHSQDGWNRVLAVRIPAPEGY